MPGFSTSCRVSLDFIETQRGRKQRLGEVQPPARGAHRGRAPQTGFIPVGMALLSQRMLSPGDVQKQKLTVGVQTPGDLAGLHTAPTQLSHPVTSTFHLQNRTVSRPMCNTKARGQHSRPTWESFTGTTRETCESEPVTLVVLHLKSGECTIHTALGGKVHL